ncbi:MAG: FtsW/RodA/SpoVE family cell cycle protein [Gammaproteobacteria bacterium]|nr:FtsW/RodA/SpoVE family cell cycle protein [Gammaproteobacteria bacterium]MCP5417777.1 FtsW/RodA/SpoVE family cell cycle protein [Chromatiaceae bacterium]
MYWYFDRPLVLTWILLLSAGLAMVYSATNFDGYYLMRQLVFIAVAITAFAITVCIDLKRLEQMSVFAIFAAIALGSLVFVPGLGRTVNGATRWLDLRFITFHTGEVIKLLMFLFLARYVSQHRETLTGSLRGLWIPILALLFLSTLLWEQPDTGTTWTMSLAVLGALYLVGLRPPFFIVYLAALLMILVATAVLSPYRLGRLSSFLDPWDDVLISGYQLAQSLIAFGRGELFGLGYGASLQKLDYLPDAHNNFIIAIVAEEFGAVGAIALMLMLLYLAHRVLRIGARAFEARNMFAGTLAASIAILLAATTLLHIAVAIGLLPTLGFGLPLISHGGTGLVVYSVMLAMATRIDLERKAGTL